MPKNKLAISEFTKQTKAPAARLKIQQSHKINQWLQRIAWSLRNFRQWARYKIQHKEQLNSIDFETVRLTGIDGYSS
jgi:hypothetical protein